MLVTVVRERRALPYEYIPFYAPSTVTTSLKLRFSSSGDESSAKNVVCAVIAGSVSSALATPTDVLKVRLQSCSANKVVKGSR